MGNTIGSGRLMYAGSMGAGRPRRTTSASPPSGSRTATCQPSVWLAATIPARDPSGVSEATTV